MTNGWGPPGTPPPNAPGGTPPPVPPSFQAPSQPGAYAGQVAPPQPTEAAGTWIGVVLSALLFLGSLAACLVTGIAASEASESEAVVVSMVTVPTVIAGLFPWIIALLTRKKGTGLAVGAPIGCGCLTWVVSLVSMAVFYAVIWPEL